jgi:hypothetical protein
MFGHVLSVHVRIDEIVVVGVPHVPLLSRVSVAIAANSHSVFSISGSVQRLLPRAPSLR